MRSRTFISDIVLNFQIISLGSFFGSKYILPIYFNKELIYDHCPFLTIDIMTSNCHQLQAKMKSKYLQLKFYETLYISLDTAKIFKSKVPKDQKLHLTPNQSLTCL